MTITEKKENKEYVKFTFGGRIKEETDKAYKLNVTSLFTEPMMAWFPKSITAIKTNEVNRHNVAFVEKWFADKLMQKDREKYPEFYKDNKDFSYFSTKEDMEEFVNSLY